MADRTLRSPAPPERPVTAPTTTHGSPLSDPLEGDTLSTRRRSEHPSAYESIAFVEGPRVLTITWLPPAPES